MSVLFTDAFDACYDNSRSFYKLSCGWVWFFVGFLLGFALLKELCWVVVVLLGLSEGDQFLLQEIQM